MVTFERLNDIGSFLLTYLATNFGYLYPNLYDSDDPASYTSKVHSAIEGSLLTTLNINIDTATKSAKKVSQIVPGDIITFPTDRWYLICGRTEFGDIVTFPDIGDDASNFSNTIKTIDVLEPDYSKITDSSLRKLLIKNQSSALQTIYADYESNTFDEPLIPLPDSALQIGDMVFIVDPIQISFTSQNEFQYFPTIRTQGDPKLPTMQHSKNVTISLIFPNQDSINYQLLNLFAMFKRTPFVNIKNKDICDYYTDLVQFQPRGYLPVALESISIQTIDGFPNTLQASITVQPFEPRALSSGLLALRSLADVRLQQSGQYINYEVSALEQNLESKLEGTNIKPEGPENHIDFAIRKSPDFRASLPFRCYYQSIFDPSDRNFVKNEYGEDVTITNTFGTAKVGEKASLQNFRTTDQQVLQHYDALANQQPIDISYQYVTKEFFQNLRDLSKERISEQTKLITELTNTAEMTNTASDLIQEIYVKLVDQKDFFNAKKAQVDDILQAMPKWLQQAGIEVNPSLIIQPSTYQPTGNVIMDLWHIMWLSTNGANVTTAYKELFSGELFKLIDPSNKSQATDVTGLAQLLKAQATTTGVIKGLSIEGTLTILNSLTSWLNDPKNGPTNRKNFALFLTIMAKNLNDILTGQYFPFSAEGTSTEETGLRQIRLPIATETIHIDNMGDIINGWSLVYVNKLVPIYLQGYEYPYFQHMGSEDITLSLNIISTAGNRFTNTINGQTSQVDLKTKLSQSSDRLYESVKILTYNSPELLNWLDPRLTLKVPKGHFFNCFGISHIVMNSVNSVNLDKSPGAWQTVINASQNELTLDKYSQIEVQSDFSKLEDAIAKLIPRISIVGGKYRVDDFYAFDESNIESKVDTIDHIIMISYAFSNWAPVLIQYIHDAAGPQQNIATLDSIESTLTRLRIRKQINIEATNALQQITDKFGIEAVSYILRQYDDLLEKQTNAMIGVLTRGQTSWVENFFSDVNRVFGGVAVSAVLAATVSLLINLGIKGSKWFIKTGKALLNVGVAGVTGAADYNLAKAAIAFSVTDTANKFKDAIEPEISTLINSCKVDIVKGYAHDIARDPIFLKKFLSKDLLGADPKSLMQTDDLVYNCYKDFDTPVLLEEPKSGDLTQKIILSPDFYLYSAGLSEFEYNIYINDGLNKITKTEKMARSLSMLEYKKTLGKLKDLQDQHSDFGGLDPVTVSGIVDYIQYGQGYDKAAHDTLANYINISADTTTEELQQFNKIKETAANWAASASQNDLAKSTPETQLLINKVNALVNDVSNFRGIALNEDIVKIDLIKAAQFTTLIEIIEFYTTLNTQLKKSLQTAQGAAIEGIVATGVNVSDLLSQAIANSGQGTEQNKNLLNAVNDLNKTLQSVLHNYKEGYKVLTNDPLINKNYNKGLFKPDSVQKGDLYLSIPQLRILEGVIYDKVGKLIRLNEYIKVRNENPGLQMNIGEFLPEFSFLDFWNIKERGDAIVKLKLTKDLLSSSKPKKGFIKMFPTFKIYFVEENKGISRSVNRFFSYNAVQSIEVINNKNNSSKTAIIRLSNAIINLTNRYSLTRESVGLVDPSDRNEAFFGTLNIKPGSPIMIRLGYSASEQNLPVIFYGKIIEMGMGPNLEIIAQSYGAQLQMDLYQEQFNFASKEKGHGDIASAVLDKIQALEKFGSKNKIENTLTEDFTPRVKDFHGNFVDRQLLTNLFGALDGSYFGRNNPRDENIYLPFDLNRNIPYRAAFQWKIYQQTVWEVLHELCLYNKNSIVAIRPYNIDGISNKSDIRETLIIGEKQGYYKYTNAYSLSSLNYTGVHNAIKSFKNALNTIKNSTNNFSKNNGYLFTLSIMDGTGTLSPYFDTVGEKQGSTNPTIFPSMRAFGLVNVGNMMDWYDVPVDSTAASIIQTLLDKTVCLVLVKYINNNIKVDSSIHYGDLAEVGFNIDNFIQLSPANQLAYVLLEIAKSGSSVNSPSVSTNTAFKLVDGVKGLPYLIQTAYNLILYLRTPSSKNPNPLTFELSDEEYYNVKAIYTNTDTNLYTDIQYKKIQSNFMITDQMDIISNNIDLNGSFHNAVNLWYKLTPVFKLDNVDVGNLNLWPIRAFGDTNDSELRILDSFQKNIDTNWWEINDMTNLLQGDISHLYTKINSHGNKDKKKKGDQNVVSTVLQATWGSWFDQSATKDTELDLPMWQCLPAFYIVALNLLKKEVETMYRGAVTIVGNPTVEPFNIMHIFDYFNDMQGAVEVEEVIHRFTPEEGYTTTITPNMITFDRQSAELDDVATLNTIFTKAEQGLNIQRVVTGLAGFLAGVGDATLVASTIGRIPVVGPWITGAGFGLVGVTVGWNAFGSITEQGTSFVYEQMANTIGRDCIDFTTLICHGVPYIAGFDGVDYTTLKTRANHFVAGKQGTITRYAAFGDPISALYLHPDNFGLLMPPWAKLGSDQKEFKDGIFSLLSTLDQLFFTK